MKFKNITLENWRQFSAIDIDFHPNVTIITGSNGSGKSTILKLLSKHFGWNSIFLATPFLNKKEGNLVYSISFLTSESYQHNVNQQNALGRINYSNGSVSELLIHSRFKSSAQYDLQISPHINVKGVHISSHRPVPKYEILQSIPTNPMSASQAYSNYFQETVNLYNSNYSQHSPTYRLKEALISMAAFGAGNQYVEKNPTIEKQFTDFKEILSKILPEELGFLDLSIRIPDIVLETKSGDFLLDASSGGIMALIDLAWQIFLYSHDKNEFVITIDEPENHLHPSMQRSLLGDLVAAFPQAQFIVVTHSPFIVSSIKDSNVYALKYESSNDKKLNERKVVSHLLDLDAKAATANEILREVLGVPITLPKWADKELQTICSEFTNQVTAESLSNLRKRLRDVGLEEFYPEALNNILSGVR